MFTGSIIGTLPIPGDPSKDGDIELTLISEHSPVGIQVSTKNLILKQPLDKEGITGLSSVLLDVACSKKETDDPVRYFCYGVSFSLILYFVRNDISSAVKYYMYLNK